MVTLACPKCKYGKLRFRHQTMDNPIYVICTNCHECYLIRLDHYRILQKETTEKLISEHRGIKAKDE